MNNSGFTQIDDATKVQNLINILNKRCKGFVSPEVLHSIVMKLDCKRQMKIDIVNSSVMINQAKVRTDVVLTDGDIINVMMQWCRCLLGHVEFGKKITTIEDGSETIIEDSPARIIAYPAIVQIEEQMLGDLDAMSTKLLIYL